MGELKKGSSTGKRAEAEKIRKAIRLLEIALEECRRQLAQLERTLLFRD